MATNKEKLNRKNIRRSLGNFVVLGLLIFASACSSEVAENKPSAGNSASNINANVPVVPQDLNNAVPVANANRPAGNANQFTGKPPKPYEEAAPEDSTFSASLGKVGLETRTFKRHPTILKIERTIDGTGSKLALYLKNGKTVEIANDKLPDIKNASSNDILKAAGLPPLVSPAAKPDDPNSKKKKSEN